MNNHVEGKESPKGAEVAPDGGINYATVTVSGARSLKPDLDLKLPQDAALAQAVGVVAWSHAHLDYVLRMMIVTLGRRSEIQPTMDETTYTSSEDLRESVSTLARQALPDSPEIIFRLNALLSRCEQETRRRNRLMHDIVCEHNGEMIVQGPKGSRSLPKVEELRRLAFKINELSQQLNNELRLGEIARTLAAKVEPKP